MLTRENLTVTACKILSYKYLKIPLNVTSMLHLDEKYDFASFLIIFTPVGVARL